MKINTSNAVASTLLCVLVATFVTGCEKKNASGVPAPGIEETKAIAEEGFIYGLPIVMNYAVMNEYAVDTKSSQFKAPFNDIYNMHRVATYEDTAIIRRILGEPDVYRRKDEFSALHRDQGGS
jgi:hypothetical protein